MSDLTLLVAEAFLLVAVGLILVFIGKLAADKWAEIVTGVLHGNPVSPGVREGMLLGMWLPWQRSPRRGAWGAAGALPAGPSRTKC